MSLASLIPAMGEEAAGDWIGRMTSGFEVRIHIDKSSDSYKQP
jgi:hypothetical protein